MFSLSNESDEATNAFYSPASSRSGSQSPSEGLLADANSAEAGVGPSTLVAATIPVSSKNPRKRRANLTRINLTSGASAISSDSDEAPSTSTNASDDDVLPAASLPKSKLSSSSNNADPNDKRMRLTSSSSSASIASQLSLASNESGGSQLSLASSTISTSDSCYDLADLEYNGGQITPPSAKSAPLARSGTVIGDGEFELVTTGGQECKAIHLRTQTIHHCMAMKQDDYKNFMAVAERIEMAKSRLTAEELRELRRLLLPEETRVIRATDNANLWYVVSPDHQGSLHTFYSSEGPAAVARNQSPWTEQQSKTIFSQIVRLSSYCHRIGIYFGDFRLQKLVYTDQKNSLIRVLHLRNIYVAPQLDDDTIYIQNKSSKCCPAYTAPEVMSFNKPYSARAADTWSLGVILYLFLTGRFPFYAPKPPVLARLIRMCQYSFKTTDKLSRSARLLVYSLLRPNPAERASAKEILMSDWLRADIWETAPSASASSQAQANKSAPLNIRLVVPESSQQTINEANPQIPPQLIRVLMQPAVARNTLYSTRSDVRVDMERLMGSLQRKVSVPVEADQAVPIPRPTEPLNTVSAAGADETVDQLGIRVSQIGHSTATLRAA